MAQWQGKSRGNLLGYRIFVAFIRWWGVGAAYQLLKVVSYYFFLFAATPKKHIMQFYIGSMGFTRYQARKLTRQNFYLIGQSLIDRVAFSYQSRDKFTYHLNGNQYLQQIADENKGGILISGHLGNWEIAGNLLKDFNKRLMSWCSMPSMNKSSNTYLEKREAELSVLFHKRRSQPYFLNQTSIRKGRIICIHGDRFLPGSRTMQLEFLGKPALFPYGPFHIASKFASPVSFVFGLKDGDYRYKLSATLPMPEGKFRKNMLKPLCSC